ncbi:MAG: ferric reductase-like transmembrane domain-containing protein [Pseudomonadota bacterium]
MKRLQFSTLIFWAALALPAIPMLIGWSRGSITAEGLLHPTGEFAARFMIIAMMITPLRMLFPKTGWLMWLAKRRRWLGVSAFAYALFHTCLYIFDMGALQPMLDEFWAVGIWTGWFAFAIFIPLAISSNDASQKWLLGRWKQLQRFVYPAAFLCLLHWIFVHNNVGPALVHFLPLAALETYRIWKTVGSKPAVARSQT